jgi:hypothetical protein
MSRHRLKVWEGDGPSAERFGGDLKKSKKKKNRSSEKGFHKLLSVPIMNVQKD